MNFAPYLNREFKQKILNDIILEYDTNSDGVYSREEVANLVKDAKSTLANIFSPFFMSRQKMINNIFEAVDTDIKDDKITLEEVEKYLKKEFNVELNSIRDKKVGDICKDIASLAANKKEP